MTLIEAADASRRRVLKATWTGTVTPALDYYCLELECGHHYHVYEPSLRSPLMCLHCVKALLADSIPTLEDWPRPPAPMPSSPPIE